MRKEKEPSMRRSLYNNKSLQMLHPNNLPKNQLPTMMVTKKLLKKLKQECSPFKQTWTLDSRQLIKEWNRWQRKMQICQTLELSQIFTGRSQIWEKTVRRSRWKV